MTDRRSLLAIARSQSVQLSVGSLIVQAIAALYFIADGIDDILSEPGHGTSLEIVMECVVALALLLAVIAGASHLRSSAKAAERQTTALNVARGSMSDLLALRFQQWGLTPSESEVALFALKGCRVSEIARLRNSAEGTVRSQLSQVYAKAQVDSQSMLIAQFIEELV